MNQTTTDKERAARSAAGKALGRLAIGVPKNYTPEERKRRADRMRDMVLRRRDERAAAREELAVVVNRMVEVVRQSVAGTAE